MAHAIVSLSAGAHNMLLSWGTDMAQDLRMRYTRICAVRVFNVTTVQQEAMSVVSNDAYVNVLSVALSVVVAQPYLIIASADYIANSVLYRVWGRSVLDGAVFTAGEFVGKNSGDVKNFFSSSVVNLLPVRVCVWSLCFCLSHLGVRGHIRGL